MQLIYITIVFLLINKTFLLFIKATTIKRFRSLFALIIREIVKIISKTIKRYRINIFIKRYINCEFKLYIEKIKTLINS